MTTLIGIKAEQGRKGVVLASDLSVTRTNWSSQGDIAYRSQTRQEAQKIYVNDNRDFALCSAGTFDQSYKDFLSDILIGKIDMEKILAEKKFPQFLEVTLSRWEGKLPDSENMNGILIASRFGGRLKLYACWPLGLIEERPWTSLGSGSKYAIEYISSIDKIIPGRVTVPEVVDIAVAGLDSASQDIYTGGLDIVVVEPAGIREFGKEIRERLSSARKTALSLIKERYSS